MFFSMKISDYTIDVEAALQSLDFATRCPEGLYGPVAYALTAGGKRLRPSLLLMTADFYGGDAAKQAAATAALGIETYHNFTLLHDDVMDKSEMRRGRQTVHARWDENTAILSGDAMLTLATQMMCGVPDASLRSVLRIFNDMALEVYEGQRYDMNFETEQTVSLEEYVEMIRLKTGALLGAAAEIGAVVAGASAKDCEAMRTFGNMLGIAFQIQDDWLDTFGDAATFGKPIGGDILNDKKTFLLVSALAKEGADAEALRAALSLEGETKVKAVTRIYKLMGVDEDARKAVSAYGAKALNALKKTSLTDSQKEAYRNLVDKLTGRKK